jgi:hypothetical protein
MPDTLTPRFPRVAQLLATHVRGEAGLPDEVGRYADTEATEQVLDLLDDIDGLLSDTTVAEAALDDFTRAHTGVWFGSGRSTLEHVGEALMRTMEARAGLRSADDLDPTTVAPPDEIRHRLAAWLEAEGLIPPEDFDGWDVADAGEGRWVLIPPGFSGMILVVTPDTVRAIRPAVESVPEALAELGIR